MNYTKLNSYIAVPPWKTRESVELAALEWVAWFNHHRLHESIG